MALDADKLFSLIDRNKDNLIDHSELVAIVRRLGVPENLADAILEFADEDKNGSISKAEFRVALTQRVYSTQLLSLLPPGAKVPTTEELLKAFSTFNSRGAPENFIHVSDLRLLLTAALPVLERDLKRQKARAARLASSKTRRKVEAPADTFAVEDGLSERVEGLIASAGPVSPEGLINYASVVSLLFKYNLD